MKIKILLLLVPVTLLSASCSLFGSQTVVAGVVKTVNGGADWQFSNTIAGTKTTMGTLSVSAMALDPQDRQIVFAGGYNDGLYKSSDSGATWKRILSNILVYDVVVHPSDSKIIYVAGLFNGHGRVLLTKDGGASWDQIFNDASDSNPVRALALNPSNPNQVVIGLGNGNVVKSSDAGLSWRLVKDFADRTNRMKWQNNTLYILFQAKGLYSSTDNGENYQSLTTSISDPSKTDFGNSGSVTYNQFFVDTVSPSLIYLTSGNGLYKSVDAGKTWNRLQLPVKSADNVVHGIAIAKNSSNVVYASIGSTIYKTTDGGTDWQTQKVATNGIINYILVDPQLPQITYAGIYATPQ